MTSPAERFYDVNGVRLRVLEAGPADGPLVVMTHGFPELAFSWRHQIPALAAAGYHVMAPDQRGYGGSSRPEAIEDYDIACLTGDVVGLIDAAGANRAAIVGHDWGSNVAWAMPLLHPDRVAAVASLSVPPVPRPLTPPTEAFRRIVGDNFFYMLYFQEVGPADTEMDADPARTMRRMLGGMQAGGSDSGGFIDRLAEPDGLPSWLSPEEFDVYVAAFTRTGFTGALNWYRCLDRNWEILGSPAATMVTAPCLFIGGTADPVLAFTRRDRAAEMVSGPYREVMLEGAGHWIQQERAAEINAELLSFLSGVSWD